MHVLPEFLVLVPECWVRDHSYNMPVLQRGMLFLAAFRRSESQARKTHLFQKSVLLPCSSGVFVLSVNII